MVKIFKKGAPEGTVNYYLCALKYKHPHLCRRFIACTTNQMMNKYAKEIDIELPQTNHDLIPHKTLLLCHKRQQRALLAAALHQIKSLQHILNWNSG